MEELEECDDGPGSGGDACSEDCRVRSVALLAPREDESDAGALAPELERTLGNGPHVAAGLDHGFAVAYAESVGSAATS